MKTPKRVLDRRRSIRIAESLPFKIGHASFESEAVTINISTNGALCLIDQDIPLMTQLKVALSLPGAKVSSRSRSISMKGVVVRKEKDALNKKYLIAVYFSEIKPADRETLERFIESRLQPET